MNITNPLRLAIGPHRAGSGRGCAMNVISWESGDTEITDFPECADSMLALVVQQVNDEICSHREGDLLCPDCSVKVLDLAHRTVGTELDMSDAARARVYVRLALDEAESVARDGEGEPVAEARRVTAAWLDGEVTSGEVRAAASAASHVSHAADAAAYAAVNAADYCTVTTNCAAAAAYAANAANAAAAAVYADGADRLGRAHLFIDRFEGLTGVRGRAPAPEVTAAAITAMVGGL